MQGKKERYSARKRQLICDCNAIQPALYIAGASVVLVILAAYRPATTWPGFIIVLIGAPVKRSVTVAST